MQENRLPPPLPTDHPHYSTCHWILSSSVCAAGTFQFYAGRRAVSFITDASCLQASEFQCCYSTRRTLAKSPPPPTLRRIHWCREVRRMFQGWKLGATSHAGAVGSVASLPRRIYDGLIGCEEFGISSACRDATRVPHSHLSSGLYKHLRRIPLLQIKLLRSWKQLPLFYNSHSSGHYPSSCLLFKTRYFRDWILCTSKGGTYSVGPN
jgi:hypothetical protein